MLTDVFCVENVVDVFSKYGSLDVDWPYKEDTNANIPPKGFAFLLFRVRYRRIQRSVARICRSDNS